MKYIFTIKYKEGKIRKVSKYFANYDLALLHAETIKLSLNSIKSNTNVEVNVMQVTESVVSNEQRKSTVYEKTSNDTVLQQGIKRSYNVH